MKTKKAVKLILTVIFLTLMWAGGSVRGDDGIETMSVTKTPAQLGYIPPAWSLKLKASKRFEPVLGGAAVLDKETGLVWEKSPDKTTTRTWITAVIDAYNSNVGGRGGWRLPTVEELRSLIDPKQSNPALPNGHPFTNVQSGYYWSSTTNVNSNKYAWYVNFYTGETYYNDKGSAFYVWFVRGGHGL